MENIVEFLEIAIRYLAEIGMALTELTGIAVLLIAFVKAVIQGIRRDPGSKLKLILAHGIALAMEFMLVGEVLHTIVSPDWQDLGVLAAVIVIRVGVTFLLHWEIKQEEKELEHEEEKNAKAPEKAD